jgi:anti-sigma28 factor (negative regulator of flagellin synthesis)
MRIDDLGRAPQTQETGKTDAVRPEGGKSNALSTHKADGDAADISGLAAALAPSDGRLEALRLRVERGDYHVSANDIARGIIDEHIGR